MCHCKCDYRSWAGLAAWKCDRTRVTSFHFLLVDSRLWYIEWMMNRAVHSLCQRRGTLCIRKNNGEIVDSKRLGCNRKSREREREQADKWISTSLEGRTTGETRPAWGSEMSVNEVGEWIEWLPRSCRHVLWVIKRLSDGESNESSSSGGRGTSDVSIHLSGGHERATCHERERERERERKGGRKRGWREGTQVEESGTCTKFRSGLLSRPFAG